MKKNFRYGASGLVCVAMLVLSGCGGGGSSSSGSSGGNGPPSSGGGENTYTVGGTLSGLSSGESVTLVNNGNTLTLNSNGSFTFPQSLDVDIPYTVAVQTQPPGEMCAVTNGSGGGPPNVTDVGVACAPSSDSILYSFNLDMSNVPSTTDGYKPRARLVMDHAGNLYGAAYYGGANNIEFQGDGALFKVSPSGTETLLYSFAGGKTDGANPAGRLVMDSSGNLFGTTAGGGANGDGTVFEFSAAGAETILYSFAGGTADGEGPQAGLIRDGAGNLYGTTAGGGANGDGTVFKLSAGGTETVLYSFAGGTADGAGPAASLVMDSAGNLYGTTPQGGAAGNGTVFKVTAAGTESLLYSFAAGTDGRSPNAGLVMDGAGNLYGTTSNGGVFGFGTVFEVKATGGESVLYSFTGGTADGANPYAGLLLDSAGNLYGTTEQAGAYNYGTAFELAPNGTEVILHSFGRGTDGQNPGAGLTMDGAGNLYGTTIAGGATFNGTVYEINAAAIAAADSTAGSAGYVVGGTVSGLNPGGAVTLLNDGTDVLTVSGNGGFAFSSRLASGSAYDVTLVSATAQTGNCQVNNGSGTVGTSNVTSIVVSCVTPTYTVGGTISGLTSGESVTLLDNGGDALTVNGNGAFTFSTSVAEASAYDVTVQSLPFGVNCPIANGSGTMAQSNVTDITLTCTPPEAVLYSFAGPDGQNPDAGLVMDSAGNFYGTTQNGGADGDGEVFEISAAGTETVLHSFAGGTADGANPQAPLIMDSAGNLYGTTVNGGADGDGTVFEVSSTGVESVLYSFAGGTTDGANPYAAVIRDSAGNFYGTTQNGGTDGAGTVFKIAANGTESVLHSFALNSTADGENPDAPLIMDGAGNLYGTTPYGGANNQGTVFKLSAGGTESILYSFAGDTTDGGLPFSGLLMDGPGNLYGTTFNGGANGGGTVFKLSTNGTESVLYSFGAGKDAANPHSVLIMDSAGNLYGTTTQGGEFGLGTVFELAADGTESVLHSFATADGVDPGAVGLVMDSAGNLYGTTQYGGANGDGVVFKVP